MKSKLLLTIVVSVLTFLFHTRVARADVGWSIYNFDMKTQVASGNPDADYSCLRVLHKISVFRGLHWNLVYSQEGSPKKLDNTWSFRSYYVNTIFGILPLVPEGYKWEVEVAVNLPDGSVKVIGNAYQNGVLALGEFSGYTTFSSIPDPLPVTKLSQLIPSDFDCKVLLSPTAISRSLEQPPCSTTVYCQWCPFYTYNNRPIDIPAGLLNRGACESCSGSPVLMDAAATVCKEAGCWGTSTVSSCIVTGSPPAPLAPAVAIAAPAVAVAE